MKIRCDLHINGGNRKLVLVQGPNEKISRLGLKLACYMLYWDEEPIVEASSDHPALYDTDFRPGLMALDITGAVSLWVECGSTTMNKLSKLTRKFPQARIVVMKETEREAMRLRKDMKNKVEREDKVKILAWPGTQFADWMSCLQEKTEIFGEGGGLMLNFVVNEHPIVAEFKTF